MRRSLTIAALAAWPLAGACGSDSSTIELGVAFPMAAMQRSTNSLHFWVLEARAGSADAPGCAALIADLADPYDPRLDLIVDHVVITAEAETANVADLPARPLLFYGEAVDFAGHTLLAGCAARTPSGGAETITLALTTPGTFDCADPATENGAQCDDGVFCTVGERCASGQCGGGVPRNCTYVADQCNAESCDEEVGCVAAPLADGRPCEDGFYCTAGDSCQAGECQAGPLRDCASADGVCHRGVCNEQFDYCESRVDTALECSDNLYCTLDDACTIGGACGGTAVDCSAASDACNVGLCSEADLGACIRSPTHENLACTTNCMSGGTCHSGACTGGTPLTPGTEGPAGAASCSDYVDNDCDGFFDADDPDC